MSTKADLESKIDRLLSLPGSSRLLQLNSNTVERAYEAYIWALCKRAVERAGGNAVLTGILSGQNPSPIVLRGSPGSMSSTAQNYCYIDCELHGKQFEIHLDVQYEGSSKATHEIDVSIYDHEGADMVRNTGRLPRSGKLLLAIECKFYTAAPVNTVQGREFVGLIRDFTKTRMNVFASNQATQNLKVYFTNKPIEPFTNLEPSNPNTEDRFVECIAQALLKWAP